MKTVKYWQIILEAAVFKKEWKVSGLRVLL